MTDGPSREDRDRRLRNLQSVMRHHASVPPTDPAASKTQPAGGSPWKKRLAALGPIGLVLIFALGKLKFLIPLLKFAKLGTLVTMFVSVWAYAMFFGWPFAVGFVLLIFVHELGHGLVMQQQGLRAGAPVFIPFVGAVIAMRSLPRDAYVEALVGIGGPILGSAGALVCLVVAWTTGGTIWYALAHTGFLINLFNLIPISPLDGGRIVGVISRWLWVVGYAVGILVFLLTHSPILFLILLLGLLNLRRTVHGPREGYFDVAPARKLTIGATYFCLLALLALAMRASEAPLQPIRSGDATGAWTAEP